MNVKVFSFVLSCVLLIIIVDLIRREKITFKYASGWIILCLLSLFFIAFDRLLFKLSRLCGFELPSNFIFFICFFGVAFLSLLLTIFLCQQNSRNDRIAQKIGLLEHDLNQLKSTILNKNKNS